MGLLNKLFKPQNKNNDIKSQPSSKDYWEVKINDGTVILIDPDLRMLPVNLRDVHTIAIITNDQGPWVPDVWLELSTDNYAHATFPMDCEGYNDVFDVISKFKGFDFDQVIKAMASTDNERFILWTNRG